ncbi:integrase, catalytic region, zinc finger, CCHC-type containing protein [Tanacetum coccineum]
MVEASHAAYTDRFHELARLVPHLVTPKSRKIERERRLEKEENVEGNLERFKNEKDCRSIPRNVNPVNARNPTVRACYECGSTDHVRSAFTRWNRAQGPGGNRLNQVVANNEEPSELGFRYEIEIASGQLVEIDKVFKGCKLEIKGHVFDIDLIPFRHGSFDVIIGLGHNLFSVGQFCDGDLEVAFRLKTCYAQNLEGDDLVIGDRESSLYTIFILDMAASSPVSLMSKASSTMSWLWHHRLLHLNFGTINDLTKHELVYGLPKFKYRKDHLCFAYERGKSKKSSHLPKVVPSTHSKLELLHMNLCGPMRVASINGKKYILMIIDAYS